MTFTLTGEDGKKKLFVEKGSYGVLLTICQDGRTCDFHVSNFEDDGEGTLEDKKECFEVIIESLTASVGNIDECLKALSE